MATKICTRCKQSKPLTDFYKSNNYKYKTNQDGHDYYCKYCRTGTHLNSRNTQKFQCTVEECNKPHYAKSYCRMHYTRVQRNGTLETKNKPVDTSKVYIYAKQEYVYKRHYMLMTKYKMTLDEFNTRAANGCEICGEFRERSLHVDHNHSCCNGSTTCGNCVRGVICNGCNTAVDKMEHGLLREDYPNIGLIKKYLEKYV